MEPKGSSLCSQEPAITSVLSQMTPVHTLKPYFIKIILMLFFPVCLVFWVIPSLQVFGLEHCMHFISSPCVLHAPSYSSSLRFDHPNSIW
jgi:hypothetical protein